MFYCALHNCYGLYGCRVCQRELIETSESVITNPEGTNEEPIIINRAIYPCPQSEAKDREIERLKGLIEDAYITGRNYFKLFNGGTTWKQFKSENNL